MAEDLNKVDTELKVAGAKTHFVYLSLYQAFNSHHRFEIEIDHEEMSQLWMDSPAKLIDLIGESVIITMKHKQTGEENEFEGIITNTSLSGYHGQKNAVILSGKSKTIKLDGKHTMDSFMDKTLQQIVNEAVENSGNGGEVTCKPVFGGMLDYVCQYNESCFDLINRLSWTYGEWFFTNGKQIFFGMPSGGKVTEVTYDKEMTSFNLSANLMPPKFNRYYYLHHDDKEIDFDAPGQVDGVEGYLHKSLAMSDKVYTSEANIPLNPNVTTMKELEDMVTVEKSRATGDMLTISGSTQTCKIKIGEKIKIKFPDTMDVSKKEVDTFTITEVSHTIDQEGHYSNSFKGVMSGIKHIPMPPCPAPVAGPQLAWVKSNADDKQLGRVKVQMQWQKKNDKTTNWIRVQTPDAGPNPHARRYKDKVLNNRGFVFIPEEDDLVMLGFEYGDPDRPYVAGSIFSEKASKGGSDDNHLKTIKTRSGHIMEFDDKEDGNWGITIKDYRGDIIHMDTKGKNITVTAPNVITLNGGEEINLNSKRITFNGSEFVHTHSPEIKIGFHGEKHPNKTIDLAGEKITSEASKNILDKSPDIDIEGSNTVEVKTTKMKLSAGSKIDMISPKIHTN